MEKISFWQVACETFSGFASEIQALAILAMLTFGLSTLALVLRFLLIGKHGENSFAGKLVYTVRRDDFEQMFIYRHIPGPEPEITVPAKRDEATEDGPESGEERG